MKKIYKYGISYSNELVDVAFDEFDAEILHEDDKFFDVKDSKHEFSINKDPKVIKSIQDILKSEYVTANEHRLFTNRHGDDFFQTYTLGFVYDTDVDEKEDIEQAMRLVEKAVTRVFKDEIIDDKINEDIEAYK